MVIREWQERGPYCFVLAGVRVSDVPCLPAMGFLESLSVLEQW